MVRQFYLIPKVKSDLLSAVDKIVIAEKFRKTKTGYFLSFSQSDQTKALDLLSIKVEPAIVCRVETIESDELYLYCFPDKTKTGGWFYRGRPLTFVYKEKGRNIKKGFLAQNDALVP
ncbi:hypothetical protein [Candidatus Magnetomonas plexicatena]|uniref:hypothetical protein n=1 Tax=Candidatus Magnetomonas plexicatena TaxID=2552947 RepID=UPI001C75B82D|nr:hypothetical protein E2O03_006815 [Nitrospirales bacterium LBB_01]